MENTNVNSASAPASGGSNPFLFSSGPAGAISSALFNLITVETELEKANLDYSMNNTKLSTTMGKVAEEFNIDSGKAQAQATKWHAYESAAGAAMIFGGVALTAGANWKDSALQGAQQENLTEAENFRAKLPNPSENPGDLASARLSEPEETIVNERIEELKQANFNSKEKTGTFTKSAVADRKNMDVKEVDKLVARKLQAVPDKALNEKLDNYIDVQTKQVNTLATGINVRTTQYKQYQDFATQFAASGAAGAQSIYQAKQGVAQGAAAMAQTTGSLASSMLGTTNSANSTAAQAIGQILGVLTAMSHAYAA